MKKLLSIIMICIACCGCVGCGSSTSQNIIVPQDIGYCQQYCDKITQMNCTGYYEPISMPLSDGGTQILNCTDFCKYELNNGVPLNPKCLYENLQNCSDIETICK